MATPSYKGYQTSVLASMGDEEAIRNSWSEVPGYEMFANTGVKSTPTDTPTDTGLSKDREVEIGLGKSVYSPMTDSEKRSYLDSLTDEQYQMMSKYKNQGYSFEASRTLLENSDGLKNPTALGTEKYNPKGNFFKNTIAGAYDSVTGLPRFLSNNLAKAVGWTAKKLGADEDKVNELVNSYIEFGENEMSGKALGADTSSAAYKITKGVGDIAQVAAGEGLARGAMKGTQIANRIGEIRNSGLLGKAAVGAAEGAADMGLYNVVAESELPSAGDLAVGATLGAAFPLAGAGIKAAKTAIKKEAGVGAEKLIEKITKVSPAKLQKFEDQFGENVGKFMNDRGLKTKGDAGTYYINNIKKVDKALGSIKGTFKSPEVDEVLAESVEFATKTADKNLNRLLELQQKAANEGLTMSEVNEVKRYFEGHTKFTYGKSQDAIKASKATNLDTRLREWQMKVAKENGLDNLAQLNRETQATRYILNNAKDAGEGILGAVDVTDELLAIHYGGLDRALATYATKSLLKSAKFQTAFVDILNRLSGHQNMDAILADLEAISKVNTEKEFDALMKKRELNPSLPAPKAGGVNDAGYTILEQGENMVSGPNGNKVMDSVTEIGGGNTQGYVNSSQAVKPQAEVSTPKAQTKVVEQTKAVEQAPKVSETVVNSEKPNLREALGDKFYSKLEKQVEMINKTRKGVKSPITVEDLNLSSDLYKNDFEKMAKEELQELQKKVDALQVGHESTKLTASQEKQLASAKTKAEKDALIKKWQKEYLERNYIDVEKVEEIAEEYNRVLKEHERIREYLYSL